MSRRSLRGGLRIAFFYAGVSYNEQGVCRMIVSAGGFIVCFHVFSALDAGQ
jgi:hypothetical protein